MLTYQALWSLYGLAIQDKFVYGPNLTGLGLGLIQLALKLVFPSKWCDWIRFPVLYGTVEVMQKVTALHTIYVEPLTSLLYLQPNPTVSLTLIVFFFISSATETWTPLHLMLFRLFPQPIRSRNMASAFVCSSLARQRDYWLREKTSAFQFLYQLLQNHPDKTRS